MPETYFEEVFRALNDGPVEYVIAGGLAAVLHGVPRFTQDIDLLVVPDEDNFLRLVAVLTRLGYVPRPPVPAAAVADPIQREAWFREKGLRAFTFRHLDKPHQEVDILLHSEIDIRAAFARATHREFRGLRIPILDRDDLITMKKCAGRKQDLSDVEILERIAR